MTKNTSSRDIPDLLKSLEKHLNLLDDYYAKAFTDNNLDYFGEIAAKIRLLAIASGSNKPLLLLLMKEFGTEPSVIYDGPPTQCSTKILLKQGDPYPLEVFLTMPCFGFGTEQDGSKSVDKREFILLFAEKHGASHEDWNHPEILRKLKYDNTFVGKEQFRIHSMRGIANRVLWTGRHFLDSLTQDVILEVTHKREININPTDPISHGVLGFIYLTRKSLKLAKKHLLKSHKLDQNVFATHWNLACLFSLLQMYDDTLNHLTAIKDKWGHTKLENI